MSNRDPLSTYRLQLTPDFGFDQAAALARYLARLGVTHLYASPYLQAAPGSTHGYDVVDPTRVNQELGGEEAWRRMCAALGEAGLGQVLDIVPNHMAMAGRQNAWWWDVLENGPSSRYALYFDVAWDPPERRLENVILMPVLGDHYGRVLKAGELVLTREGGSFLVRYHEHEFPIAPASLDALLEVAAKRTHSRELQALAEECRGLPDLTPEQVHEAEERHRAKESIRERLAELFAFDPLVARGVDGVVAWIGESRDRLDGLLDRQNYRLARWRMAGHDLDYRRFFDINSLVGVRVEDERVFEATHGLVLGWLASGVLDGLRIDHPDGLRDPEQYFWRLHNRSGRAWVVAEKILALDEELPATWPVAGSTGYEFLNRVLGLFIDPAGERPLTTTYQRFTHEETEYKEAAHRAKLRTQRQLLAADVNRLVQVFVNVCEANREYRDYTRHELTEAVRETIACLPVYRTYVRPLEQRVSEEDRRYVLESVAEAKRRRPDLDPELFDFLAGVLLLEHTGVHEAEFVARFQQTSSPVTAKGIEDTVFYTYNRLVALNEVGGDPGRFGTSLDEFHAACQTAAGKRPRAMLSTSTHDTKRSEDVRARLALLSEVPGEWARAVGRWSQINARHRRGEWPDRNAEYLLYQTLVGAHPLGVERAAAYMEKASKEAKAHTSWIDPNPAYDQALRAFVEGCLGDPEFTADLHDFVRPLLMAGWMNSLSMKLLALTAPGVPDLYQGSELWDLSLVDPDNRRPVDFELRTRLLEESADMTVEAAWARLDEGLPKLLLVSRALALRRRRPDLFVDASYHPIRAHGQKADHLVAFVRGGACVTLAPRLVIGLAGGWGDTTVQLPAGHWRDQLSGRELEGGEVAVDEVLDAFPVALLTR
ncbi:MAG TPA: malto-oligosyltrehalose synthase [Candidatus Dormibacteraeota bacterium]